LKQRASNFSRSLYGTFALATSETVSIASGNRLLQAVGNMSVMYILHNNHILHILYILPIHFVQDAFDPAGIEFNTFLTTEQDGEVHKLSLHESKVHWLEMCIHNIFRRFNILSQPWMVINGWISIGLIPW
jgi:hypothetical protein